MHHCMMAFRRQCMCENFLQAHMPFLLPMESSFCLVYMNLLIFYGHVDQFTFLRSEGGGGVPALLLILYGYYTVEPSPWH